MPAGEREPVPVIGEIARLRVAIHDLRIEAQKAQLTAAKQLEILARVAALEAATEVLKGKAVDAASGLATVSRDIAELRRYLGGDPQLGDRGRLMEITDTIAANHVETMRRFDTLDQRRKEEQAERERIAGERRTRWSNWQIAIVGGVVSIGTVLLAFFLVHH